MTDPGTSIIARLAEALGVPRKAVSGFGKADATIEVDLHLWGGNHYIGWRHRGKIHGTITITPDGDVLTTRTHYSKWAPPITVDAPAIAAAMIAAAAELAELAETLIPKTNTPGAKDLGLQHFIIKMVEDCGDEDQQRIFGQGMVKFNSTFRDEYELDFMKASATERSAFLKQIEEEKFPELSEFYSLVKNLTIRGYTNSKFYMTEVVPYELVPGRYNPSFKIA